jgi:hypothetical protein
MDTSPEEEKEKEQTKTINNVKETKILVESLLIISPSLQKNYK